MNGFSLLLIMLSLLSSTTYTHIEGDTNDNTINDSLTNENDIVEEYNNEQPYYYDIFGPDTIFVTNMDNFKVIPLGDLHKEQSPISHDFDKDGIDETIHIGLGQSNYEITGIYKGQKYGLHQILLEVVEKFGWGDNEIHLEPKCSLQITYHDLDSDNIDELIISFGGIDAMCYSVVYKIQNSTTVAFSYVGHINGGSNIELLEDNTIWCPIGSQGLGDTYVLKNGRLLFNYYEEE